MYVTTATASRFPAAVTINVEDADDLDLIQRIAGLEVTIPKALNNRNDSKERAREFLAALRDAVSGL
jgi:hypothetical protein